MTASPEEKLKRSGAQITELPRKRFQVKALSECSWRSAERYLVKGVLAPGDLAVIFGPPGCGKSLLGPLLGHAVACGRPVFGRRTKQARVLYIAAEAGADMEVRMAALRDRFGNTEHLSLIADTFDLQSQHNVDLPPLLEEVARLKPGLIIVDTLAAAFPGLEENDAASMGGAVRSLRRLSQPSGAAVVVIHHSSKVGGATPRGHGVLNGDADVTMRVEGQDQAARAVIFGKNRNGASGPAFNFTIELVHHGEDEDGDAIQRPVAIEQINAPTTPQRKSLNSAQTKFLSELQEIFALQAAHKLPSDPSASPMLQLTRDELRKALRGRGYFNAAPHAPLTDNDRRRFSDHINALKKFNKIDTAGDRIWLT